MNYNPYNIKNNKHKNLKEFIIYIRNMNKKLCVLLIIILFIFIIICKFFIIIEPGQVGVKINLMGDEKGVSTKTLCTGMHWIAPWKRVYRFPTFIQNDTWEEKNEFNFQTSEGLSVSSSVGISYRLDIDKIPFLFSQYRRGIHEITQLFLKNYIRDALNKTASKFKIEDLYSSEKQDFFECVEKHLKSHVQEKGIIIEKVYLIGKMHLPESVVTALNLKIEAIQRAHQRENELKEAEAVARKHIAIAQGEADSQLIKARAEAESNKLVMQSINERLITLQAVQKWDGKLPSTFAGDIVNILKEIKQ